MNDEILILEKILVELQKPHSLIVSSISLIFAIFSFLISLKSLTMIKKQIDLSKKIMDLKSISGIYDYVCLLLNKCNENYKNGVVNAILGLEYDNMDVDEWLPRLMYNISFFDDKLAKAIQFLNSINRNTDLFEYEERLELLKHELEEYMMGAK